MSWCQRCPSLCHCFIHFRISPNQSEPTSSWMWRQTSCSLLQACRTEWCRSVTQWTLWSCLCLTPTVRHSVCVAGLWRLGLHGFQQEAHGSAGLWYSHQSKWNHWGYSNIQRYFFPMCVSASHSQGTMCLWTWVTFHHSGWPTWATPVTPDASTATFDSAGSVVCLHSRHRLV